MELPKHYIAEIVIIIISLAVGLFVHHETHLISAALVAGLCVEILAQLFRIRIEHEPHWRLFSESFKEHPNALTKIEELRGFSVPFIYSNESNRDEIFEKLHLGVMREFVGTIKAIDGNSVSLPMNDIHDISYDICDVTKFGAFCTAPETTLDMFFTDRGKKIQKKQFEVAKRTKKIHKFCRLFIFESYSTISWDYFKLMEEHNNNDIDVLVALSSDVDRIFKVHSWDDKNDFGLWDNKYLLTIADHVDGRKMRVIKDLNLIKTAKLIIRDLRKDALTWDDFRLTFTNNVFNIDHWESRAEQLLELPPANGPGQKDCETMIDIMKETYDPSSSKVAIYGLTKSLIDSVSNHCNSDGNLNQIDVVDIRRTSPATTEHTKYNVSNWHSWLPEEKYDFVFGDDILCNLKLWNTPHFFRSLSKAMKPGGKFITRATAQYQPGMIHPRWSESIQKLRLFDDTNGATENGLSINDLSEGIVYELAIPTLHNKDFYNDDEGSFFFGEWDLRLQDEPGHTDFISKLKLPYHVNMTSVEFRELSKMAAPYFRVEQTFPVYSVWENEEICKKYPNHAQVAEMFHQYYRIIVFVNQGDAA